MMKTVCMLSRSLLLKLSLVLLILVGTGACSKKLKTSIEDLPPRKNIVTPVSYINLPVKLSRIALNRSLTEVVNWVFREGLTLDGNFHCMINVAEEPDIQVWQRDITFKVPLSIEIRSLSKRNPLSANGNLELTLKTKLNLVNGRFESQTELLEYRWTKTPVIRFLGVAIPVELIANQLIKKYRSRLCSEIDEQINTSLDLEKTKKQVTDYFADPFFVSDDGLLKVFSTPKEISIGPFQMDNDYIILPTTWYLENLIASDKPYKRSPPILVNSRLFYDTRSAFAIQAAIPLKYIEGILAEQVANQEFGTGASMVKVRNLTLDGRSNVLMVNFDTEGGFKGKFQMRFVPEFDPVAGKLQLKDFDLRLISGKAVNKSLFLLIKNRVSNLIRKSIESELNTFLDGYVLTTKQFLDNSELHPGVKLNGKLNSVDVNDFWIQDSNVYFSLRFRLELFVKIDQIDLGPHLKY